MAVRLSSAGGASHAYIIEGRAGKARDAFVTELIQELECSETDESKRPCGNCDACKLIAAGTHPDVVRMERSGRQGNYITTDAGELAKRLEMRPYGRHLVGLIDEAETLNEETQNKLLKTLEEPPEDVIILLVTSKSEELLATIRSRCVLMRMPETDDSADEELAKKREELTRLARMLVSGDTAFYEFREALGKSVKSNEDALSLIGLAEKEIRDLIDIGIDTGSCAEMLEAAERTSADIQMGKVGMERGKALKKLFLQYRDI